LPSFSSIIAFRWGSAKLASIGLRAHDPHGHDLGHEGAHGAHGPEIPPADGKDADLEQASSGVLDTGIAQIVGIAILEFGVVFHSVLIGLTLAVDPAFKVLFVVLVFHQTFEGLGLGTRLAFMPLQPREQWVPLAGAVVYGLSTPLGIAVGLAVRDSYNPGSATASIVSGVLDATSSGILLYTGLVELLAHEFLFNPAMHHVSNARLMFASGSLLFGAGVMALLGRWA